MSERTSKQGLCCHHQPEPWIQRMGPRGKWKSVGNAPQAQGNPSLGGKSCRNHFYKRGTQKDACHTEGLNTCWMKKSKYKNKNNWSLEFLNNLHFGNKFPGQFSSAFPRVTRWLLSREAERKALSSCQVSCCEQVWDRTMSSQHLRAPSPQVGLIFAVYRRETRKDRAHTHPPVPALSHCWAIRI